MATAMLVAMTALARPGANHYSQLSNKQGQNLWEAIYSCTQQGYSDLGYDGLLTAYKKTDVDQNGNLIDMYGGCSFTFSENCGSYKNECDCYNREHSIPKSWWGGSPDKSKQGSDIFHVVPTDGKVNGIRSSYAFGETTNFDYTYNGNKRGASTLSGYSGTVFEPRDEYKGDFARGYFGTMAKWELKATSGAGSAIFTGNYTAAGNFGLTEYGITLLMKWHRQDPVSEKELKRNDAIEETQGNRNPFIDYPELAEYLWGNKKGQTVIMSELTCAYDGDGQQVITPYISSPQNGTSFTMNSCKDQQTALTINVHGANLNSSTSLSVTGTDASMFQVSPSVLTAAQVENGHDVALIFTPDTTGTFSASVVISNDSIDDITIYVTATVADCGSTDSTEVEIPDGDYYLLESEPQEWSGIYLIANSTYSYCLNASLADDLSGIKSAANKLGVEINNKTIKATSAIDAAAIRIEAAADGNYTLLSGKNYYLGISENSNTLNSSTQVMTVALSMSGSDVVIGGTGSLSSRTLRYNNSAGMFRFYTSGQQPVQLYRKRVQHTPSGVEQRQTFRINIENGMFMFDNAKNAEIQMFDIYGRLFFAERTNHASVALPKGIYILLVDGKPQKLIND